MPIIKSDVLMCLKKQKFDKLYIKFWREELSGSRLNRDINLIIKLANLTLNSRVLDLGAGFGRISYGLAAQGIDVIAVERSEEVFTEAIHRSHPKCQFILGDWHNPTWQGHFDCVLFWFTTLCAGCEADMSSLQIAHSFVKEHGSLLIETRHWDSMKRHFDSITERRCKDGLLVETHTYDPISGVQTTEESFEIGSKTICRQYQIRRYGFPELREMCFRAGFRNIDGFDENGSPLAIDSERVVLRARV